MIYAHDVDLAAMGNDAMTDREGVKVAGLGLLGPLLVLASVAGFYA
ncbi:hypothetical protein TPY_1020 [Sulfobacillus acidophilus TPY]|uniref:Uncharacterized protein n=1 Tax=Sulfobacillus acidophilus (strain ATCC 700253 / DSM 10332 / NAL) TaxID=679936 RepID=G8TX87_SULAD|nr:hypothetical protein TPY_1020 [Sulfobacillus acidophilus TPY]AEW06089.1 hypothetical protein Sulac_2627 [Sulfobacillus acidophilus DSM 10332]